MIDTLHTYDTLKEGEIPDLQARAMTLAIKNAESDIVLDVKTVIDRRFDEFSRAYDARFDQLERQFEARFTQFEARFTQFEGRFATKAELAIAIAHIETRLVRWMFLFWVGQLALMVALVKVLH